MAIPTEKPPRKYSRRLSVGVPGFEPGMTGPESVVLPLHHTPMELFISVLRLQRYEEFLNCKQKSDIFLKKNCFPALQTGCPPYIKTIQSADTAAVRS